MLCFPVPLTNGHSMPFSHLSGAPSCSNTLFQFISVSTQASALKFFNSLGPSSTFSIASGNFKSQKVPSRSSSPILSFYQKNCEAHGIQMTGSSLEAESFYNLSTVSWEQRGGVRFPLNLLFHLFLHLSALIPAASVSTPFPREAFGWSINYKWKRSQVTTLYLRGRGNIHRPQSFCHCQSPRNFSQVMATK